MLVQVVEHDHVIGPVGNILKNLAAQLLRQVFVGDVVVALKELQEIVLVESVTAGEDHDIEFSCGRGSVFCVGRDAERRQTENSQQGQERGTN